MGRKSLSLPFFNLGEIKLRFINYSASQSTFKLTLDPSEDCILLLLGTDLLSCSKQSSNHHGRIHNRFAKLGLAVKVHLKDVNVDGISNSSSLWFYNVQGLFHVSFEYLDVEMQKSCLLHFTTLWLSAIDQDTLPESLVLVFDDAANTSARRSDVDCCSGDESNFLQSAETQQLISTGELSVTRNEIVPCDKLVSEYGDIDVELNTDVNHSHLLETDHDRLYESICEKLGMIDDVAAVEDVTRKLCSLLKFFWSECLADDHYCSTTSTAFPFHILDQYAETVGEDSVLGENLSRSDSTYDVDGRRGTMLRLVCDWVGNELAQLRGTISERADRFKAQNIQRIDSLPSARHTVDFIFPQCMVILILRWMNGGVAGDDSPETRDKKTTIHRAASVENGKQKAVGIVDEDHCYTADCSGDHVFAFVQLILEFANGCLVSGITHVLYPRLLQAQL